MKRRQFLKISAHATACAYLGLGTPLLAQDAEPDAEAGASGADEGAPDAASDAGTTPPTERVPGLNAVEIRLGMSADFSGRAAQVSIDALRGALAWLNEINDQGGVEGRWLTLLPQDDGGDPRRAVRHVRALFDTPEVFCLFNCLGTETLGQVLPILHAHRHKDAWLLGEISGAEAQRRPPFAEQVFPVRASNRQEMRALVAELRRAGGRRFGLLYPVTPHGRSGAEAAHGMIAEAGAQLVAEATWRHGPSLERHLELGLGHLRESGVDAVISTGDGEVAVRFLGKARAAGWNIPTAIGATLDSDSWYELLRPIPDGAPIFTSRAVPLLTEQSPALEELRRLLDRWQPKVPERLSSLRVPADRLSAATLEGFLHARLLTAGLRLAGPWPTRRGVRAALESLNSYDLGIGSRLSFGAAGRRGLEEVFLARWRDGAFEPVDAPAAASSDEAAALAPGASAPDTAQGAVIEPATAASSASEETTPASADINPDGTNPDESN